MKIEAGGVSRSRPTDLAEINSLFVKLEYSGTLLAA